jgi:hypothetical protein
MKVISAILAILIALMTGCASQGAAPAEAQAASTQVESVVEAEETVMAPEAITVSEVTAAAAEAMTDITAVSEENNTAEEEDNEMEDTMRLLICETEVPVTWEENASVEALKELSPITIQMSMYGGFEQVGALGQSIVRNDKQTTTNYGDIVLYSGDQIVVFYGSNSWSYTRLGHIDLTQKEMQDLLSGGDVTITLQK